MVLVPGASVETGDGPGAAPVVGVAATAAAAAGAANVAAAAAAAAAAAEKHAQRAIDIINKAKEKNTCRITNHK